MDNTTKALDDETTAEMAEVDCANLEEEEENFQSSQLPVTQPSQPSTQPMRSIWRTIGKRGINNDNESDSENETSKDPPPKRIGIDTKSDPQTSGLQMPLGKDENHGKEMALLRTQIARLSAELNRLKSNQPTRTDLGDVSQERTEILNRTFNIAEIRSEMENNINRTSDLFLKEMKIEFGWTWRNPANEHEAIILLEELFIIRERLRMNVLKLRQGFTFRFSPKSTTPMAAYKHFTNIGAALTTLDGAMQSLSTGMISEHYLVLYEKVNEQMAWLLEKFKGVENKISHNCWKRVANLAHHVDRQTAIWADKKQKTIGLNPKLVDLADQGAPENSNESSTTRVRASSHPLSKQQQLDASVVTDKSKNPPPTPKNGTKQHDPRSRSKNNGGPSTSTTGPHGPSRTYANAVRSKPVSNAPAQYDQRDYRPNYENSWPYRPNYRKQPYSNTNHYSYNYAPRSNYRKHDYSNYNSHVNAKNRYSNVNYNSNFAPNYRSKYYQPRYGNWNYIDSEYDNEWYGPQSRSTFRNRQPFPSARFRGREGY